MNFIQFELRSWNSPRTRIYATRCIARSTCYLHYKRHEAIFSKVFIQLLTLSKHFPSSGAIIESDRQHDNVIKWNHFLRHWPFVRGIHRSPRPVTRSFDVFFGLRLNLSKQSRRRWFETPLRSLWRHCNEVLVRRGLLKPTVVIMATFPSLVTPKNDTINETPNH